MIVNFLSKRTDVGCTNPTYFHYARHRHYDHQFYQARCIRAKLCQAQKLCQNPCNNNVSKNETKEEQDSTGISPRDYILVSSFHLPPRRAFSCWNTGPPVGLRRRGPWWCNDLYHCCGNYDNQTYSRASDVPVPVAGPARGGLGSR